MPTTYASYLSEDIYAVFSAEVSPDELGSGEPVWVLGDITLESLTILDLAISIEQFEAFPKELRAGILALADDLDFDGEVTEDEPDYDEDSYDD